MPDPALQSIMPSSEDVEKQTIYASAVGAPTYSSNLEEGETAEFGEVKELRRGLHQRHIQMIALAGCIGTVNTSS